MKASNALKDSFDNMEVPIKKTDALAIYLDSGNVSEVNKKIVNDYLKKTMRNLSQQTVRYNRAVMLFVLKHIKKDLDKLIIDDIEEYQFAVDDWTKKDGSIIANTTKTQYIVDFKRFLRWYGKRYNKDYLDLAGNLKKYGSSKPKSSSDMLTKDEILKLISVIQNPRDKALVAALSEAGCRIGELLACKVKHVEQTSDGIRLAFTETKTEESVRTVYIMYMASYIKDWINKYHPDRDNTDAPLWPVKEKINTPLEYHAFYITLKKAVAKAGIKKRVHPHLFRHTRATMLAKQLNEPLLRKYMGWAPGSNMVAIYTHISSEDTEIKLKELAGLVDKKTEKGFEVGRCPRCQAVVPAESQYCPQCGMLIVKEVQQTNDTISRELMAFLLSQPQLAEKLAALMQK